MVDILKLIEDRCPDGVPYMRLDEVFDIVGGYSPSMDNEEFWTGGDVPFFRMENLNRCGCKLDSTKTDMFCTMDSVRGKPFPGMSLIVATCATIGVHALVCEDFLANQRFSVLKPAVFVPKIAGSRTKIAGLALDMDFANYYAFKLDEWCRANTNQGTFKTVNMTGFRAFPWPIPPLDVQREIVAILDRFTELEAELEAELEDREKQYAYYREQLLTFDASVERLTLGDLCVCLPKAILKQTDISDDGRYPVINAGRGYQGYYSDFNNAGNAVTFSSRGENAGCVNYHDSEFWAGGLCYPYRSKNETVCLTKFLYYSFVQQEVWIRQTLVSDGGIPALNKSDIERIRIAVPPLDVQREILVILDKFHGYCYDMKSGLAGEMALRRQQYEYYRDLLLSFPEKV